MPAASGGCAHRRRARVPSKHEGLPELGECEPARLQPRSAPGSWAVGVGCPSALPCLSLRWKGSHLTPYSMFQVRLGAVWGPCLPSGQEELEPGSVSRVIQGAPVRAQAGMRDSPGRLCRGRRSRLPLQAPGWVGQALGPQPAREECGGQGAAQRPEGQASEAVSKGGDLFWETTRWVTAGLKQRHVYTAQLCRASGGRAEATQSLLPKPRSLNSQGEMAADKGSSRGN